MENYFWVAAESHTFVKDKSLEYKGPLVLDLLALAGPSRLNVDVGEKKMTCLVKAIMARAFEIALLLERQTTLHMEGIWRTTAKLLIGDIPELTCGICPCPVYPSQQVEEASESVLCLSHRVQVDVSNCSSEDVTILQWALADVEGPVTSLGRAWCSEKYALIGVPDCVPPGSKSIPDGIWSSILSLLVRLGVEDLTTRLERAAVFVWDVVDCAVHKGLGDATVIDLAEKYCRCSICTEAVQEETPDTSREQTAESTSDCFPDELIHKWWDSGETARPSESLIVLNCFKLRSTTAARSEITSPTTEFLKLRTVNLFAHLRNFRILLNENLRRAGTSHSDANKLSNKILQREMERTARDSRTRGNPIPPALLDVISRDISGDLVLRLNLIEDSSRFSSSRTISKCFVKYMVNNPSGTPERGWIRNEFSLYYFRPPEASYKSTYRLTPCRLFTVPAVDSPVPYRRECNTCKVETSDEDSESDVILSTRGSYGAALWKLISTKDK